MPEHVWSRKKLGFSCSDTPLVKGGIIRLGSRLIRESPTDYLFKKAQIMKLLENHVNYKADNSRKLWTILTFMIWHQIYIEKQYEPRKILQYAVN
ncbi:asparagine synthase-related protein [Peribacillus simplex]|uniref:asparagine synthase-related protein n=1 Tax=Peribacillus simplex TaxID=1478 RepID=UPI003D27FFD5